MTPKRHNWSIRPIYVPNFINERIIVFAQWSGNKNMKPGRPPACPCALWTDIIFSY